MDRPIDNSARKTWRAIAYASAIVAVCAAAYFGLRADGNSKVNVPLDAVTVGRVRKDVFQDYVAVLGSVEPIQTVYLDATEGGRVEEIFIREGTALRKGDPILRLSNDALLLEISNYETEVARAVNDLRSMRVTLENQEYHNRAQLVELQYDLSKARREVANNEELIKHGDIPRDTYQLSKEGYERKTKLYELLAQKTALDATSIAARIAANEEMVESMQKNLAAIRARLQKLLLRAPVDGELATLNPELGQVVAHGTRIGTVNILTSYKLKAGVDEHYITRVLPKQKASCEFGEREFAATVLKVYPEVRDGKFLVDLVFDGVVPPSIRIGQTSRVRLELGEPQGAVLIPRGAFYGSTGGQWIYVVDAASNVATKRPIRIGRQNPAFFEVIEGLQPGESVITSGYETLGNRDTVVLKQRER